MKNENSDLIQSQASDDWRPMPKMNENQNKKFKTVVIVVLGILCVVLLLLAGYEKYKSGVLVKEMKEQISVHYTTFRGQLQEMTKHLNEGQYEEAEESYIQALQAEGDMQSIAVMLLTTGFLDKEKEWQFDAICTEITKRSNALADEFGRNSERVWQLRAELKEWFQKDAHQDVFRLSYEEFMRAMKFPD